MVDRPRSGPTSKGPPPLVSVVVATHDRPELLPGALRSVLAQTHARLEVVVVDDASSDPVEPVVRAIAPGDDRVQVVRLPDNRGAAGARNAGLERAGGDLVAFLDDDDRWVPDKLARQVAHLEAHPDVGLVTCGHYRLRERRATPQRAARGSGSGDVFRGPARFDAEQLLWVNFAGSFSFVVVRRSALGNELEVDESFECAEDWDLWLRCARRAPVGVVPEPLAVYVAHGGERLTATALKRRGLERFERKHAGTMSPACRAFQRAHQRMDAGEGVMKRGHVLAAVAGAPAGVRALLLREQAARQLGRLRGDPGLAERTLARLVPLGDGRPPATGT